MACIQIHLKADRVLVLVVGFQMISHVFFRVVVVVRLGACASQQPGFNSIQGPLTNHSPIIFRYTVPLTKDLDFQICCECTT